MPVGGSHIGENPTYGILGEMLETGNANFSL